MPNWRGPGEQVHHQNRRQPSDAPVSRFWLVELDEDLKSKFTTRTGVWCGIKSVNGVKAVTDMEVISRATLDEVLLPPEQSMITSLGRFKKTRRP